VKEFVGGTGIVLCVLGFAYLGAGPTTNREIKWSVGAFLVGFALFVLAEVAL
jgi:hypothetical protein